MPRVLLVPGWKTSPTSVSREGQAPESHSCCWLDRLPPQLVQRGQHKAPEMSCRPAETRQLQADHHTDNSMQLSQPKYSTKIDLSPGILSQEAHFWEKTRGFIPNSPPEQAHGHQAMTNEISLDSKNSFKPGQKPPPWFNVLAHLPD